MRKISLLLFCFFCTIMQGQIVDLEKFSKGKFYSSEEIKDEDNSIKGYFLLYENDKVAKETYQLEYVVLDENLTKVTNGFITEMKYESWLVDAEKIKSRVSVYKDKLLIQLTDYIQGSEFFRRYRLLDVKNNELSKPFIFAKGEMKLDPVFDRKNTNAINNNSEEMFFFEGVGLVVDSKMLDKEENLTQNYLAHLDDNLKEVWRYTYNNSSDKKLKWLHYLKSDDDIITMFARGSKNNSLRQYVNEVSILFIDSKTGILRSEFIFPDLDKYSYRVVDCKISDDEIYVAGNYSKALKNGNIDDIDNVGLFSFTFEKSSGKLKKSNYVKWESLSGKLDVNKNGYVKKEGNLFPHKMLLLDSGKIIVAAETFIQAPITTNNMYFLEFNDKLQLNQVFEVEKFRNKFPRTVAHSSDIKSYGLFDFIDYQDLGDDEYLFFINDNEKKSRNRKKSTLYGIISYSDGQFKRQTLELKTENSTKYIYNAKKGYLLLVEDFDVENKSSEFRLEKINY